MKRVGLSRFRLALGRPAALSTPVRPSLLEPQGFRIRPRETPPLTVPPKNGTSSAER